jgi:hypothetical protein
MEDVRKGGILLRDNLRPRTIAESELKFSGDLDSRTFVYEIDAKSDQVLVYATPQSYPETGRVSLVLQLTDAFLDDSLMKGESAGAVCAKMYRQIRGADRQGARASLNDETFKPYGVRAHCY